MVCVGGSGVGRVLPGVRRVRTRAVLMPQLSDSKTLWSFSAQRAMGPCMGWSAFLAILAASLAVAISARVSMGGRLSSFWRASLPVLVGEILRPMSWILSVRRRRAAARLPCPRRVLGWYSTKSSAYPRSLTPLGKSS